MTLFFKNSTINDCLQCDAKNDSPPSLDDLVSLFETLDTKMNGKIAVKDVEIFLKNFEKFREESSHIGSGLGDALGFAAARTAAQSQQANAASLFIEEEKDER